MRYIFIVLVILAALGAGVWWFHFRDTTQTTEIPDPPPPVDPIPGVGVTIPAPGSKPAASEDEPGEETTPTPTDEEEVTETDEPEETIVTFNVTGTMYSFSPPTMSVRKGDRVRVNFTSQNGSHDFVIDELNARTSILASGKSESIEFIASETGQFEYYCSVGGHRQMGMKGTLTVTE